MKAAREKGCIIREQGFEWLQRRHEAQKAGEQYFQSAETRILSMAKQSS